MLIIVAVAAAVLIPTLAARRSKQAVGVAASTPIGYTVEGQPLYQQVPRTNTFAILVLVFGLIFWPLGIIFGHVALDQIRRSGESGAGLAIAGLILGYLWLAIIAIPLLLSIFI